MSLFMNLCVSVHARVCVYICMCDVRVCLHMSACVCSFLSVITLPSFFFYSCFYIILLFLTVVNLSTLLFIDINANHFFIKCRHTLFISLCTPKFKSIISTLFVFLYKLINAHKRQFINLK